MILFHQNKPRVSGALLSAVLVFIALASPIFAQPPGTTTRVSVSSAGVEGNGLSYFPAISGDGRYVAFASTASNLVAGDSNNFCDNNSDQVFNENCSDIFVHDRQTGMTSRVSISSSGAQANGGSGDPGISSDGRYIVFTSVASNLVNGDNNNFCNGYFRWGTNTNNCPDVFLHDRQTGETTLISKIANGTSGNASSGIPAISGDGRYLTFVSGATDFVANDTTNRWVDLFLHDRQTGTTKRISVAADGSQSNEYTFAFPHGISYDGRYITFESGASNLVSGDINSSSDIFVYDQQTNQISLVSVTPQGKAGNSYSFTPSISNDGRYINFYSYASDIVANDTNNNCNGYSTNCADIFVYDQVTKETTRVSVDSTGQEGNNESFLGVISENGRFIAFYSKSTNLVDNDTNQKTDAFLHDRQTQQTYRISVSSTGLQGNKGIYTGAGLPDISDNGQVIVFDALDDNLVANDTNNQVDVFVHEFSLPTPTVTPSPSPTATTTSTATPSPTITPSPSATNTALPSPTTTHTPSATITSTTSPIATSTPTATPITTPATVTPTLQPPISIKLLPNSSTTIANYDRSIILQLPNGLVTQSTTITLTLLPAPQHPTLGYQWVYPAFDITATDNQGQPVTQFNTSFTVMVNYKLSPNISQTNSLKLYFWHTTLKQWTEACTVKRLCQHNSLNHQIIVQLDHLTQFAILAATHRVYLPIVVKF